MRLSIIAFAALSTAVHAETRYDRYNGTIGSAELAGDRVDVPLLHGPFGSSNPYVQVSIGDDQYLMALTTSAGGVWVSERVAREQELKVTAGNRRLINLHGKKGKFGLGGEAKNAPLASMQIGGLTLTDVNVATQERDTDVQDQAQGGKSWTTTREFGTQTDGYIGLDALPAGISWAVLPSEGIVSFAVDGSSLIADGTTVAVERKPSAVVQFGTKAERIYVPSHVVVPGFTVRGELNGESIDLEMPASVELSWGGSAAVWPGKLPSKGDIRHQRLDVTLASPEILLGSVQFPTTTVAEFTSIDGLEELNGLTIGSDVLSKYDVAMDREAGTLTLKQADTVKRSDPLGFMIDQAEQAVAQPEADEEGAESSESTDAPKVPGSAEDWSRLLDLHRANGDHDAALGAAINAVSLDERDCSDWSRLGRSHLEVGDIGAAIQAYEKASGIYHAWYDLPLEDRKTIKEELDELDAEEKEAHEHHVAVPSCHRADAALARLTFAAGDLMTVEKLYRERLDLDDDLALVAGTALVARGEYANAHEPLRQAMKMGRGAQSTTRLALAAAYNGQGNWESASKLFERVIETDQTIQTIIFYLDAVRQTQGDEAAMKAANSLIDAYPDSPGARYGWGYYAVSSGNQATMDLARSGGDAWFAEFSARFPSSSYVAGARARWMSLWDASSVATQKAVRGALSKQPNNKDALLAKAAVESAKGDQVAADELTLKAAQLGIDHIGYATLLTTLGQ